MRLVPLDECFILRARCKERLADHGVAAGLRVFKLLLYLGKRHCIDRLLCVHCTAVCNENRRIFGENRVLIVELQCAYKRLAQTL